jgi:hypothetical protein
MAYLRIEEQRDSSEWETLLQITSAKGCWETISLVCTAVVGHPQVQQQAPTFGGTTEEPNWLPSEFCVTIGDGLWLVHNVLTCVDSPTWGICGWIDG